MEHQRVTSAVQLATSRRAYPGPNGTVAFEPSVFPPWPRTIPPFVGNALVAGDDGRLYVRRTPVFEADSMMIDVIEKAGGRSATYAFPPRSRLVAVSVRGLYVTLRNDDDEEVLVRYRITKH